MKYSYEFKNLVHSWKNCRSLKVIITSAWYIHTPVHFIPKTIRFMVMCAVSLKYITHKNQVLPLKLKLTSTSYTTTQKHYSPRVQCVPIHPCTQTHVPFLHCPWSWHLSSHVFCSHLVPDQPASHRHRPSSH